MMTDVATADVYFGTKLNQGVWPSATSTQKNLALAQANRQVNNLAFRGNRLDPEQLDEFPRAGMTGIPEAIKNAIHEEALAILDGREIEIEQQNLSVEATSFSSLRTQYNRKQQPDNILAGILSYTAWNFLVPFLRDPQQTKVSRS